MLTVSRKPLTIALVSGKGGVGKTVLASDIGWVSSQVARTVVMDLDFQNQGLKGLFAPHVSFSSANALDALFNPQDEEVQRPVEVSEKLGFLPSVSWLRGTSQDEIRRCTNAPDFQDRLACLIQALHDKRQVEIVILDCHGGVDPVSLAAFRTCDNTLMVTEADSVAFNGTLELLGYYETRCRELQSEVSPPTLADRPADGLKKTSASGAPSNIRFVVNRLPSKYRWEDLERIYRRLVAKGMGTFSLDRSVFCYIPIEESLAESVGEYPFYVPLAPKSIYSRKVHYMVYSLVDGRLELPSDYESLAAFRKPKYRRKVERTVTSYEHKNTQSIIRFFAYYSILYIIFLVLVAVAAILSASHRLPSSREDIVALLSGSLFYSVVFSVVFVLLLGPLLWYPLRAIFGLMFLYRDRHRFQKALFRAVSPELSLWQRFTLAKLFVLRIGTSIIPFLTVAYGILLAVFALFWLGTYLLSHFQAHG